MLSKESLVSPGSDYYIYTPSTQARELFLCPMIVGRFQYLPGYCQRRNSLDSFLVMYLTRGMCQGECGGRRFRAREGQVVVLDCRAPHAYWTEEGWEAEWLHFDGPNARGYYNAVTEGGPVVTLKNSCRFEKNLRRIYTQFRENIPVREAMLNNYIVNLLTELLVGRELASSGAPSAGIIEDSVAYINEHLSRELSLEDLAAQASLSPFYFSRLFKRETGFSPHKYILATRINNARFLLRSTGDSVKSICFTVGFTSESSFCTAFKKETGLTPSQYRERLREPQTERASDRKSKAIPGNDAALRKR